VSRVALVVQRWHDSIVGGSEALAWQYAHLLAAAHEVELLTTTALDYVTWANELPAGTERHGPVLVRRFPVDRPRGSYFHRLNARWARVLEADRGGPWRPALAAEWARHQGPDSAALTDFLEARGRDYAAILFLTYGYATTLHGVAVAPTDHTFLVPTLHDEPAAYLPCFRPMARRVRGVLWLTEAERDIGHAVWGELPGAVTGMAVTAAPAAAPPAGEPYLLYCGRIDVFKGADALLDYARRYRRARGGPRLVLTGDDKLGLRREPGVEYRGRVSEAEKFALMAGAAAFVMPSRWESFSAATLEAMAQGTPALVNGACAVLADHVRLSGGGAAYTDYPSFERGLDTLLAARAAMGARAREYVLGRYREDAVRGRLLAALAPCLGRAG
jgi:glycosyltransferase involved in cell wall biosynthesis